MIKGSYNKNNSSKKANTNEQKKSQNKTHLSKYISSEKLKQFSLI